MQLCSLLCTHVEKKVSLVEATSLSTTSRIFPIRYLLAAPQEVIIHHGGRGVPGSRVTGPQPLVPTLAQVVQAVNMFSVKVENTEASRQVPFLQAEDRAFLKQSLDL